MLYLEHGKPMIFGKDKNKGIRFNGTQLEVVEIGKDCGLDDVLVHDEKIDNHTMAYLLSQMVHDPKDEKPFPECVGVLRNVQHATYEETLEAQIQSVQAKGKGDLEKLFRNDDLWVVE